MRRFSPFVILLLCAVTGAWAQTPPLSPQTPEAGAAVAADPQAPAPIAPRSTALRQDRAGRPVIALTVNGRGPFDMVVDTGAQTTVIAPSLAQALRLAPLPGESISVVGVSGRAQVALYPVDELDSELFSARFVALPALPNPGSTDARGILGMAHFAQGKLSFDHRAGRLSFAASSAAPAGTVALKGRLESEVLLHVPVRIDGVVFDALVDTGAATSVINWAGIAALGWQRDDARLQAAGGIRGATQAASRVMSARLDKVQIGPARLSNVPVLVTIPPDGAPPEAPSLILGIDLLAALSVYAVDFPRAELQIGVPH